MFFYYEEYKEFEKKKYNRIEQETWDFFIKDGDMYGFDEREGQQDMSLDITQCISEHQHIVVEAGVGIGKSFAYIVPLLLYNKYFKKPVVIATSTIALQEQLSTDLETISKKLNYFPEIIIAKGQTHFLCIKKATEYLCADEKESHALILQEIQNNAAERKDFSVQIKNKLWDKICVENFSSKKCAICEFNRNCRYYNLRNEMLSTRGIIVCNQDLLTVHLRKMATDQKELLNRAVSLIVVDEAHNLEDKVRNSYTIGYSENKILNIAENAIRSIKISDERIDKEFSCLENNLKKLYNKFKNQIKKQIEKDPDYMKYAERFYVNFTLNIKDLLQKINISLSKINDIMDFFLLNKEQHQFERLRHEVEEFEEIVGFFKSVVTSLNENLYWLEQNGRIVSLVSCPKNIDKKVHTLFFERDFSTILTSATITGTSTGAIEERYSYIKKNLGFPSSPSGFLSDPKQSPFPYDEHTMIYYCSDLPHPTSKREEFLLKGTERLVELLNISKGKSLVLFTAKTDLEYVFDKLSKMDLPFNVLAQDDGSSQAKILKEFKDDINSVLLATGSYWEGINVEGESLSNLVVFRLPFPVPDPIIDYKCSISNDPMMDVRVPEMIIKLKQGVGRLIRSKTDKGIVCILDPRVGDDNDYPYKEIVWDALPMKRKTNSVDEIRKFYNTVVESNA